MKKILLLTLLCLSANAGLPPAQSKGTADTSFITTFQTDYGTIPITHTGTKAALGIIPITAGGTGNTTGTATISPNLTGQVTSVGNATTLLNSAVTGQAITGYVSAAGTVAATDSILQAVQKLNGNIAGISSSLTGPITATGGVSSITSQTGTGTKFVVDTSPTLITPTATTSLTTPLIIGGTGTTQTLIHKTTTGVGAVGADQIFQVGSNGSTEAMRILNSGFVGINNASPGVQLHVIGGASAINTEYLIGRFESASAKGFTGGYATDGTGVPKEARMRSIGSIPLAVGTSAFQQALYILNTNGAVGIGTIAPAGALDVTSTTLGFLPPRVTTTQKNAITGVAGMIVYDSTLGSLSTYNGTAWFDLTASTALSVATKTASTYTIVATDNVILADCTSNIITITLPTAVGRSGAVFNIKKIDSTGNQLTIATTSSQTIDGLTTQVIGLQYKGFTVVSNGSNWSII